MVLGVEIDGAVGRSRGREVVDVEGVLMFAGRPRSRRAAALERSTPELGEIEGGVQQSRRPSFYS